MRPGRGHIFDNTHTLHEMLHLRFVSSSGPSALGRLYGVDHSTIIYHCRRNKSIISVIGGEIQIMQMQMRATQQAATKVDPWVDYTGEKLNPGKSYAEYVAERKKREAGAGIKGLTPEQRAAIFN